MDTVPTQIECCIIAVFSVARKILLNTPALIMSENNECLVEAKTA